MTTFPIRSFPPLDVKWSLRGVTNGGDTSIGGLNRVGRTDGGGYWMCTMSGIWLHETAQIKYFRVMEGLMNGGASPIVVPALEAAFANWPGGVVPSNPFTPGVINMTVNDDAALRSPSLNIKVTDGDPLAGGERVSITHATLGVRLYTIVAAGTPDGDGVQFCAISPPLREATDADTAVDAQNPGCVVRLINPEDTFDALNQSRTANVTLQFQECFDVT